MKKLILTIIVVPIIFSCTLNSNLKDEKITQFMSQETKSTITIRELDGGMAEEVREQSTKSTIRVPKPNNEKKHIPEFGGERTSK